MHIVTDLPESTALGYSGIPVILDRQTQMKIRLLCQNDIESPQLARLIFERIICKRGVLDTNSSGWWHPVYKPILDLGTLLLES
jgi:hypothetical protein